MSSSSPQPKNLSAASGTATGVKLADLIDRYLAAARRYGKPVALSLFGLSRADTETAFSQFDEDYMISRFLHFSQRSGESYRINGFPQTHVSIDASIQSIL